MHWDIHTYLNSEHSPVFTLSHTGAMTTADQLDWSGMTKDQLWHRLSGAPDLGMASLFWFPHAQLMPFSDPFKVVTRQLVDLLCTADGLLSISMRGPEDPSERKDDGCLVVDICHCVDQQGSSVWTKDGKTCIAEPPDIRFDDIPKSVTVVYVKAYLYSHPSFVLFKGSLT